MSEYPMIRADKEAVQPDPNALFSDIDDAVFQDDKKVEHIVDTLGVSYEEARGMLGVKPPEYTTPHTEVLTDTEPTEGVSVELGARAMAIANIMAAYNQANKTIGASISSTFGNRYDRPDEVLQNMSVKTGRLLNATQKDIKVLAASEDLRATGVAEAEIAAIEAGIERSLVTEYGPGKAYAADRAKVTRKVAATTRKNRRLAA